MDKWDRVIHRITYEYKYSMLPYPTIMTGLVNAIAYDNVKWRTAMSISRVLHRIQEATVWESGEKYV